MSTIYSCLCKHLQVEPPLKKFERHSRKSYVGLVSMEKEYMERLNVLITEMEQWFGPMRDYTPYLIEVTYTHI